jgi:hypothetical protein
MIFLSKPNSSGVTKSISSVDILDYMLAQMAMEILLNLQGDSLKAQIIYAIDELMKRKDFILLLFNSRHFDLFRERSQVYSSKQACPPFRGTLPLL